VFKKQSTLPEVDGDRLKLAREALGLSQKELALKVCLSHRHIAQLEANQLAIFFSHKHKVQVAKKLGVALGLLDSEYLTYKIIDEKAKSFKSDTFSEPPVNLPNKSDLFALVKDQSGIKPKIFLIPTLAVGIVALGIGTQIYTKELSMSDLAQLIGFKIPMSQLNAATPRAQAVNVLNPAQDIPSIANENEISLRSILPDSCSFQESQLTHYQTRNPSKKGEMVYLLSKEHQSVCVIDSQNKVVSLDLATGDSKSVYGQAPFTVVSSDLSKFDLYFQGWKVQSDALGKQAIRLEEAEYLAPN
jgi:hypothetical protein